MSTTDISTVESRQQANSYTGEKTFWRVIVSAISAYCVGVMLLSIAIWIVEDSFAKGLKVFATAIVVGAAIAVAGGLLGFLFGMPKAFTPEQPRPTSNGPSESGSPRVTTSTPKSAAAKTSSEGQGATKTASESGTPQRSFDPAWNNNNLVEVSDWLTKIVVGVSLVQLNTILEWTGTTGMSIGSAAGLTDDLAKGFGVAVILLNFGFGFLVTYIYARTLLTVMFASVWRRVEDQFLREMEPLQQALKKQEDKSDEMQSMVLDMAKETRGPSAVHARLYRPPPKGFQKAIELANALLDEPEHQGDAKLWSYLACGYGQQHAHLTNTGGSAENIDRAANKAFEAVQKALELNPERKAWLRALWDQDDPKHHPDEDDLVSLWTDPVQRDRFAPLLQA